MDVIFSNIYFNPVHPASYGGIYKLYKYAKLENDSIKLNDVRNWLSAQNTYTLHKPARKVFSRNKIYVSYIDEQWECDLMDMSRLSRQNRGFNYILNAIDCFSKYLFSVPTKSKKPTEIIAALKKIFKNRKPTKLRTDKGKEFDNKLFRAFCQKNNIRFFTTQNSTIKCAMVERVNRTLKNKIYRYLTEKLTRKYIDVLPQIVQSYNSSIHSTTKMAPDDIDTEDEQIVFENIYNSPNLLSIMRTKRIRPKLTTGDTVRQKYDLSVFDKSYYQLWDNVVYKVDKVFDKMKRPQYTIELEGEKFKRRFYPEELQKVSINENTLYAIEKIIRKRTHKGQKQVLVKWRGYPPSHNQWIPESHVRNR